MAENTSQTPAVEAPASDQPGPFEATGNPGTGTVKVAGHLHPFRIFDGRVEYQLRSGEWKPTPESYEVV